MSSATAVSAVSGTIKLDPAPTANEEDFSPEKITCFLNQFLFVKVFYH